MRCWRRSPHSRADVKLDVHLAAAARGEIVAELFASAAVIVPAERGEQHDGVGHAALAAASGGIVRQHVEEFAIAAVLSEFEHTQVDLAVEFEVHASGPRFLFGQSRCESDPLAMMATCSPELSMACRVASPRIRLSSSVVNSGEAIETTFAQPSAFM